MLDDEKEVLKSRGRKPLPAPDVPGKTEYERFENLTRRLIASKPPKGNGKKKKASGK